MEYGNGQKKASVLRKEENSNGMDDSYFSNDYIFNSQKEKNAHEIECFRVLVNNL